MENGKWKVESEFCERVKPEYVRAKVCDCVAKQTACPKDSKIQEGYFKPSAKKNINMSLRSTDDILSAEAIPLCKVGFFTPLQRRGKKFNVNNKNIRISWRGFNALRKFFPNEKPSLRISKTRELVLKFYSPRRREVSNLA